MTAATAEAEASAAPPAAAPASPSPTPTVPAVPFPPMIESARRMRDRIEQWRRHLHRHPELSFREFETTRYLREQVAALPGWRIEPLPHPTGLLAVMDVPGATETVAIRADIDALPIQELSGLPFCSATGGVSHMCGHDGHASMALAAAALLSARRTRLTRRVKIVFQPAEEVAPGGAKGIVEAGLIDDVSEIAALHCYPDLPVGTIGLRAGPQMAASDRFGVTVRGRGGHGASPDLCVDPVMVASHCIAALHGIVSRDVDPVEPAVVTVGQFKAGTAFNVIPSEAAFSGTLRAFSEPVRALLHRRVREVVTAVAEAHGARADIDLRFGYPPVVNHPETVRRLRELAESLTGDPSRVVESRPWCAGEDFAYYVQKTRGAFVLLGVGNPDKGSTHPCHSPYFRIDEDALPLGAALLAAFCAR
jgi:amidohydrolase